MKRTHALELVLVNWNGVFFQSYPLDRHVTALEGSNGAGKTTVMIAAYTAILPDMTRLRFANVGESAATGGDKGIWGRLGDDGSAWSVLRLRLPDGSQVMAGVHLVRKAEPTVEAKPFAIIELDPELRADEILLLHSDGHEQVPVFPELQEQVARLGGRMIPFSTLKAYFEWLYQVGITPLDLSGDDERNKFNEMLRTSMTGGMSRGVTDELRAFLLKGQGSLAETLNRMRGNVDACRATRRKVDEARQVEQEISHVLDAGQQMFAAAVGASRARSQELTRRADDAQETSDRAEHELANLQREFDEAASEQQQVANLAAQAETDRETTAQNLQKVAEAHAILGELLGVNVKLQAAKRSLDGADSTLRLAKDERDKAKSRQDEALAHRERTAKGLADLQAGLEELHRQAAAYREANGALERARQHLGHVEPDVPVLEALARDKASQLDAVDRLRANLAARIASATRHRAEHAGVMAALARIIGTAPDPGEALEIARRELARLVDADNLAKSASRLKSTADDLDRRAKRQQQVIAQAHHLGGLRTAHSVNAALVDCERQLLEAYGTKQRAAGDRDNAKSKIDQARSKRQELELQQAEWATLSELAERLARDWETDVRNGQNVRELRELLDREREASRQEAKELEDQSERVRAELCDLRDSGGAFSQELLMARDLVGGELLARRFEDVSIDEAPAFEALLGPLAQAIVVEDLPDAVETLQQAPKGPGTLWLMASTDERLTGTAETMPGELRGTTAVVVHDGVTRLTRIPAKPTLGKLTRDRRVAELQSQAGRLDEKASTHKKIARKAEAALNDSERLLQRTGVLEAGDQQQALVALNTDVQSWTVVQREQHVAVETADREAKALQQRVQALRTLLPDSALLDESDLAAVAVETHEELKRAIQAGLEIQRVAPDRRIVLERLDALGRTPDSDAEVAHLQDQLDDVNRGRQKLSLGIEALGAVLANPGALEYADAESGLADQSPLRPQFEAAHERAKRAAGEAELAVRNADGEVNRRQDGRNDAYAVQQSFASAQERLRERLAALEVEDASAPALELAKARQTEAEDHLKVVLAREKELIADASRLQERVSSAQTARGVANEAAVKAAKEAQPAQEQWRALAEGARQAGVLGAAEALTARPPLAGLAGSVQWHTEAQSSARVLLDRLGHARDATEMIKQVEQLATPQEQRASEAYLNAWLTVRDWLCRRVPAHVAESGEPIEALRRLKEELGDLSDRLQRQENLLRGESHTVATHIDAQIRRAHGQIRRLNKDLLNVRFGSIRGVEIHVQRLDQMNQVLEALREGPAQAMLFQEEMTVEEALETLLRRYGGGKTGGERLLDYREYMTLRVQVRRQASENWEEANPARLSTGEAIGVGAALMMVVLTAWESDARLIVGKRTAGTLRLLFLDEANRLSSDNLAVLFELCGSLDLQLLIAAPEVAQSTGNTTYHLSRGIDEAGRHEVTVHGRRAVVA